MAEISKSILDIIAKKQKAIANGDDILFSNFNAIEKKIFEAVKKKALQINTKSGKAIFDDTSVDIINELNNVIKDAIQSSKYPSDVKSYLRQFDVIKKFNFDVHEDVNDLDPDELDDLVNPMQKQIVQTTLDGLVGSGIDTNFTEPLKQGIFKNIVAGSTIGDLESWISQYINTNPEKLGQFKKYVGQISRDALNQFDGQINARIADEYGLDAYRYVGSLIEDSRPQCRRWISYRILLKDELESEITWANNNGSGMIPGTNRENFSVYRGGYNCRHEAIPFKMTKSQKKEYDQLLKQRNKIEAEDEDELDDQINEVKTDVIDNSKELKKQQAKNELDPAYYYSSASKENNDAFFQLVNDQDDASGIAKDDQTCIAMMTSKENNAVKSSNVTGKFPFDTNGKKTTRIDSLDSSAKGSCNIFNEALSIRFDPPNDKVILKGYDDYLVDKNGTDANDMQMNNFLRGKTKGSDVYIDEKGIEYYRLTQSKKMVPFSISDVTNAVDGNIAPTITHEFGHLIHNRYDPRWEIGQSSGNKVVLQVRKKILDFAQKKGIILQDAPSAYGASSWSEFYAESFSAYVHAPAWFEKNHKKAFDFFIELNQEYGIDMATIKQYK